MLLSEKTASELGLFWFIWSSVYNSITTICNPTRS